MVKINNKIIYRLITKLLNYTNICMYNLYRNYYLNFVDKFTVLLFRDTGFFMKDMHSVWFINNICSFLHYNISIRYCFYLRFGFKTFFPKIKKVSIFTDVLSDTYVTHGNVNIQPILAYFLLESLLCVDPYYFAGYHNQNLFSSNYSALIPNKIILSCLAASSNIFFIFQLLNFLTQNYKNVQKGGNDFFVKKINNNTGKIIIKISNIQYISANLKERVYYYAFPFYVEIDLSNSNYEKSFFIFKMLKIL